MCAPFLSGALKGCAGFLVVPRFWFRVCFGLCVSFQLCVGFVFVLFRFRVRVLVRVGSVVGSCVGRGPLAEHRVW